MFNFYVVLARHDMVTDAGRATTFWSKFEAASLQTKSTKNEGPSENIGFPDNPFEYSRRKKI